MKKYEAVLFLKCAKIKKECQQRHAPLPLGDWLNMTDVDGILMSKQIKPSQKQQPNNP
jgi:hypothetical protein